MAWEVMMRHHLHMPSYFLGTFTEYPFLDRLNRLLEVFFKSFDFI